MCDLFIKCLCLKCIVHAIYFAWNIIHLLSNGEGDMNIENHISPEGNARGKYDFSGR